MKEKNTADKLAEKAFYSKAVHKSWVAHTSAFGPIMEPAFADDFQTRVHLTAALNFLSNRKIKQSVEKLQQIKEKCVNDADWAAWYFFMGVAAEMSSKPAEIITCYEKAADYHHKFYLPYFKLARYAHFDADFDVAEKWYWKSISCLEGGTMAEREAAALASCYANLCSCLTMMHRYEDACIALDRSKAAADKVPSRMATEAILYAAMGNHERTEEILSLIQKQVPAYLEPTRDMTNQILSGTHAQFSALPIEDEKVSRFWTWFASENITEESLNKELTKVFSFMQRPLQARISEDQILLRDFYVTALTEGYQTLTAACPEEIGKKYRFEIVH